MTTYQKETIILTLNELLLQERCPPQWRRHDLYLFRDEQVVFYVGQSDKAYDRVWRHLRDGFKGRSDIGRFIRCNWPRSVRFVVELMNSQAAHFAVVDHNLDAAEKHLIEKFAPCFNKMMNKNPTPVPEGYLLLTNLLRRPRHINDMIKYATRIAQTQDNRRGWE